MITFKESSGDKNIQITKYLSNHKDRRITSLFVALVLLLAFNPFVPNAPFLYTLETSENLTVFWCFQGVDKGCFGSEWINRIFPLEYDHVFVWIQLRSVKIKLGNTEHLLKTDNSKIVTTSIAEGVSRRCSVKGIHKNLAKFTGKNVCHSLFFHEAAGLRPLITDHPLHSHFEHFFGHSFLFFSECWIY